MLLFELVGAVVQYAVARLVQSELGRVGLVLLALATVGLKAKNAALTYSAAIFFVLLMVQA
ncbi:hypothetical protein LXH13_22230 [Streptomyces spinosirectus]|jgi:hypothetical protein|uniref:hypothetical protein n=1 Tax=Streptomyces TaxID=1883 RepID=UPI000FFE4A94|nr:MULTISPECIES: hypothetical protein [Streptomyces]MBY8340032.1 hypothetical protein [Streptomyces plumbidurans]UIR19586.1 hypothetical protein LXH13_22230 [Streptomyces spinosirectus]